MIDGSPGPLMGGYRDRIARHIEYRCGEGLIWPSIGGIFPSSRVPALILSDSGMETDLIFHEGFDLPLFASFTMLDNSASTDALRNYYRRHMEVARDAHVRFLFEAATWRASIAWGWQLGLDETAVAEVNRRAIDLMVQLRDEAEATQGPMVISGLIGPRDDAYIPTAGVLESPFGA